MAEFSQKRRSIIRALIIGVPGLWFLGRYFTTPAVSETLLLTVADRQIPERGALVFRQLRLAVIREQGEVYALSLICTHLGCTLTVTEQQLTCPCHGSTFDRRGQVTRSPADRSLPRLRLQRQRDNWLVYG